MECNADADCNSLGSGFTCEQGSCRNLGDACILNGVIYADGTSFMDDCNGCTCNDGTASCDTAVCMDGGMDAAIVPIDITCDDDSDAGVPYPSRLVVREAPSLCAGGNTVLAQAGVELIGNGPNLEAFAINATDAYWFSWNDLEIVRAEIGTGRSWRFDQNNLDITALAIDGCQIVMGGRDSSDVVSVRFDGSDPRWLGFGVPTGTAGPEHIMLDATHAYVAYWDFLQRVPRTGGTVERLRTRAVGSSVGPSMVMHGDRILWAENTESGNATGAIVSVAKDGIGTVDVLASDLAHPQSLALDSTHLYIALSGTSDGLGNHSNDGSIARMPITGGPVEPLRVIGRPVVSIAVDDTYVYWLQASPSGITQRSLWKAPKADLQNETKVADNAWSFRLDATHIYWNQPCLTGNTSEGFLVRVPKEQN